MYAKIHVPIILANNTGADGECTYDADYDVCDDGDCNTLDTYNYDTCECESAVVIPPDCDDGDPTTADSYDETTCMCVNTPINSGCTDALACNYDPAAEVDDGSCYSVGDSCNDGNPLTVNDTWNVSCLCEGEESGEAIPTVGEWGLIILALLLLNLGVLYIRQTAIR